MDYLNCIKETHQKIKDILPTLTANQYDYYKKDKMPVSKTIMVQTNKSWNEVLDTLGLPHPLDRGTLARLSHSLHLLEKKIKDTFDIGWNEKSFQLAGRGFRPDSYYSERTLANDGRFFVLDVKLCISAAPITIYKYLPLFKDDSFIANKGQSTFFENWLPAEATEKPFIHYDEEGQTSMVLQNNILYIAYLIGKPRSDVIPCSTIRGKRSAKKKKLPENMEVRYIDFFELPQLYCELAGLSCDAQQVAWILEWAQFIKDTVVGLKEDASSISGAMKEVIKQGYALSDAGLLA